jgi:CheY-like chemotaxis protein
MVKRILSRAGHDVSMFDDGAALLVEAHMHHPDLVITDNEMPAMTGLQVMEELHNSADTADIPVILASGSVSESDAVDVLHTGDQVVGKPFTAAQLRNGVDAALALRPAAS